MRGQAHSDETRAAVMAALLTGQSVSQVATQFSLSKSIVSRWRLQLSGTELQQVRTDRRDTIETLLLDYVRQNLKTLAAQSEFAGRTKYLQKQRASELAVLHGVIADKTVRILAALQPEPELEYSQLADPALEASPVS